MTQTTVDLDPRELLTAIHNSLNQRFFAAEKATAKRLFQALVRGSQAPFLSVTTANSGEIRSMLTLDVSEFQGKLNFGIFRKALAVHLHRVSEQLRTQGPLNIYHDESQSGNMIYHLPGVIEKNGQINCVVTGVEDFKPGSFTVKVQFLNPGQFVVDQQRDTQADE